MVVEAREVDGEDGAGDKVQARHEGHAADVHRRALTRQPRDVVRELSHLSLRRWWSASSRCGANSSVAIILRSARHRGTGGQPSDGAYRVLAGGVRHGPGGEHGVMPLQELPGHGGGGDDDRGDRAEADGHERAVDLG